MENLSITSNEQFIQNSISLILLASNFIENKKIKRRKKIYKKKGNKICCLCQATNTPLWRYIEGKNACNACAIRYKKIKIL